MEIDETDLRKGYYRSPFFIGSFMAIGLGLWAGTASFGYAAAILTFINTDLGPDKNFTWVSLIYNVTLSVCLGPMGRLSDIFGRRWFFIGGGIIGVVGSIVCATAKSVPVLIGGNVLLGVASATQLCFHFAIGELVPMKYRYYGNSAIYVFSIAGSGFGPAISMAFVAHYPNLGWRGVYWLLLAINGAALACWALFYFPPTFHDKHKRDIDSKMYWIKHFDYVGVFLYASGFIVFLLGLSWGGALYAWNSAAVISSLVIGFFILVLFVLWEIYAPLKEPLVPMHLFKSGRWVAAVILLGLGAGVYYAFSIIWPAQVTVLYGDGDLMKIGFYSVIVGLPIIAGQIISGLVTTKIGKQKYQCMAAFVFGGTFLGAAASGTPDNKNTTMTLIALGCFFIGWNESICLTNTTILVKDQRDIGVAGGLAGSIRSGMCAVLTAIYVAVYSNRLTAEIADQVPSAVLKAGLPQSSLTDYMTALGAGTASAASAIPGLTSQVIAVGARAYKQASSDAYSTVYLSTIAFSVVGFILTFFAPNTEELMSGQVAATLNNEGVKNESEVKHIEA
ncbi:MFS general substrate transporter [Trichodelitschia bisporula]|uniref:MFS general substrate transporter n=1 Tax=Trichodelitschia bisporula TaxID=703511 RepID=A0A6G1I6X3_9PEZI|nr:MFS general substrate transporter [Trichodelitschia bisporula]